MFLIVNLISFGPLPNQTFLKIFITSPCTTLTTPSQLKRIYKDGVYSSNADCSLCLGSETLLHVVAGCQSCLERFTWRYNSVLNFLAEIPLQAEYRIFADRPGFNNPSIITGERYRPDLLLENTNKSVLYIIELTIGFESNLESNAHRKKTKYKHLSADTAILKRLRRRKLAMLVGFEVYLHIPSGMF